MKSMFAAYLLLILTSGNPKGNETHHMSKEPGVKQFRFRFVSFARKNSFSSVARCSKASPDLAFFDFASFNLTPYKNYFYSCSKQKILG